MKILTTPIDGVLTVELTRLADHRGSFSRVFCNRELETILEERQIVQVNHSVTSKAGSISGMHYQYPPHAEMKFLRCIKGKVFDVAVDLRKNSNTFLKWYAKILSPENNVMFVIPEGCAHGFQTLEDDSELIYLHTNYYEPNSEGGILFIDQALNIEWPMAHTDISERDKEQLKLNNQFSGIVI